MAFWRRSTPAPAPGVSVVAGDRPVATYARILDGAHLWLELESPTGGTLALVHPDGSVVGVDSVDGAAVGADRTTALVLDLTPLPGDGDGEFPLRCVGNDGTSRPVHLGDHPKGAPIPTQTTPDGRFRFSVGADEAGDLRVSRTTVAPAARVRRVGLADGGLQVCWTSSGTPSRLLLRDPTGAVLSEVDAVADDGYLCASLHTEDLPADVSAATVWVGEDAAGSSDGPRPLRRAYDDLADPAGTVLLPETRTRDGGQETVLRLTWSEDGVLGVERVSEDVGTA